MIWFEKDRHLEWRKKNLLVDKIPLPMMMKKRIILMMMLKSDVDHDEDGQDHHDHGGEKGGERKAQMRLQNHLTCLVFWICPKFFWWITT